MEQGTSSTSVEQSELEHEQRYVDKVYERLDELVRRATAAERAGLERGRLDYTGEIKEDDYRTLYERDVLVGHAARRLSVLDAQREGLVFGRLDQTGGVTRYVGRIGIRDDEHEPLVIDWRAPAAAVFYQATPVEPMGVIRRRVLRTRGQRVLALEDDLLDTEAAGDDLVVLGDGALIAALSAARGPRMRDIIATIQREQDEIIRSPLQGATLITGGPGTGKTVVALHRAAYLLYTHRRRIAGGGVLVVGPSPVFMSYIERVLPSLGEHEATLRSIGEVMSGFSATRRDPYDAQLVKGSLRMRTVLARAAREPAPGAPREFKIFLAGRMLRLDEQQLDAIRREVLRGSAKPNPARKDAGRALCRVLWRQANESEPLAMSPEEFDEELRDSDEYQAFLLAWWPAQSAREVFDRLRRDPERLARHAKGILRRDEIEALVRSWRPTRPGDPGERGESASADKDREAADARNREQAGARDREAAENGDLSEYSVHDIPLLDELHWQLGEAPPPPPKEVDPLAVLEDEEVQELRPFTERRADARQAREEEQYDGYAHILVDEAQDLSPMQWRMLGRRGSRASWTIVGDPAQSAWPDPGEATRAMDAALGKRPRRRFTLSTNYRNSAEIFEAAAELIRPEFPDLPLPVAARRTGLPPEHRVVAPNGLLDAVHGAVRDLVDAVEGTIGVIAPEERLAEVGDLLAATDLLDGAVAGEHEVGDEADSEGRSRVTVLSGAASKGLEFDGVVVVEPSAILKESPVGRRILYVVLTRATQRLVTVGTDEAWRGRGDAGAPSKERAAGEDRDRDRSAP